MYRLNRVCNVFINELRSGRGSALWGPALHPATTCQGAAEPQQPPSNYQRNHRYASLSEPLTQGGKEAHPVKARYLSLVQSGALKHDPEQWKVVERLGLMFDEVQSYSAAMQGHEARMQEYLVRKQTRLTQLEAEEALQLQQQQQQRQPQVAGQPQEPTGGWSWLPSWLSQSGSQAASSSRPQPAPLTPEQQAKIAAAVRESKVLKELGPPPAPPRPPKGLYLWGSVGSGKSLLMDLFFDALSGSSSLQGLRQPRRMHFNAAMLEVHSRLHRLDQQERSRQKSIEAAGSSAHDEDDDDNDKEEDMKLDLPSHSKRGIFKYWDPESQRQREAKAAFLAIRRHMRLARTGRRHPHALAKANSAQLRQVAAEFLLSQSAAGAAAPAAGAHSQGRNFHYASVLCFDEMQVSDVFSAVALKGLMEGLTAAGCVVVTTSNRTPRHLPRHGLHEDMFDNLILTLETSCDVTELSSKDDYRRLMLQDKSLDAATTASIAAAWQLPALLGGAETPDAAPPLADPLALLPSTFIYPLGPSTQSVLDEAWEKLVAAARARGAAVPAPTSIPVMFGRSLDVPQASGGLARFRFEDLCARPLGPADYVALASSFHTVFISGVPVMSMQVRDQARRFITLVDELYNARTRLVCSAAGPPDHLFSGGIGPNESEPILDLEQLQFETAVEGSKLRTDSTADGGVAPVAVTRAAAHDAAHTLGGAEEQFAFARAVSRLFEMQSQRYLAISSLARKWN